MRTSVFALALLLRGAEPGKTVLSRRRFLDWAWKLAEARFGRVEFEKTECPPELDAPCYAIETRMWSIDEAIDTSAPGGYQAHLPFRGFMYYGVGEKSYMQLQEKDYTTVRVVTSGDPGCAFAHPKMQELSSAVTGPSEVKVTETMIKRLEKSDKESGSVTVAVEPVEGLEVGMTVGGHHNEDVKDVASSAIGNIFKPGRKEMCVPTSVMIARTCKSPPRKTYVGGSPSGEDDLVFTHPGGDYAVFVPLTDKFRSFFEPIFACVSEFNIRPDDANLDDGPAR